MREPRFAEFTGRHLADERPLLPLAAGPAAGQESRHAADL